MPSGRVGYSKARKTRYFPVEIRLATSIMDASYDLGHTIKDDEVDDQHTTIGWKRQ
jgi:hypothetical protein